jgi:hypothetical protein
MSPGEAAGSAPATGAANDAARPAAGPTHHTTRTARGTAAHFHGLAGNGDGGCFGSDRRWHHVGERGGLGSGGEGGGGDPGGEGGEERATMHHGTFSLWTCSNHLDRFEQHPGPHHLNC